MNDIRIVGVVLGMLGALGIVVFNFDFGNTTAPAIVSVLVFAAGIVLILRDW